MTVERAIELAAKHHAGQRDTGGPYIYHPLRVMLAVPEEYRVVAVLHDILEDTEVPPRLLETELSSEEWDALRLLTHEDGQSYGAYILEISSTDGRPGRIAQTVKRADLEDNLRRMTPEFRSLEPRYRHALALLGGGPIL